MSAAYIAAAVRTPVGRRGGALREWHPVDLLAHALSALVARTRLDPGEIDDVIAGCVDQVGEQALNLARSAALAAGFPDSVPGVTVDRQCGSSQQAVDFAAAGVMAGVADVVIACGVESMTRVPMFANAPDASSVYGSRFRARFDLAPDAFVHQGDAAEAIARRWDLSREALDAFAVASHARADRATREGRFVAEIVPVMVETDAGPFEMAADEGIRPSTTVEGLAGLRTVFSEEGRLTAGNSSQISDGAAALLICSEDALGRLGLEPLARVHSMALAGVDPIEMLTGPIPATRKVLGRAGLGLDDIGVFEVNEAFAPIPLAWAKELGVEDLERVNPNGGAIALGHPLGCSGARLMTTLVHELLRGGHRYGLQTMCEGGGTANATILERV